MLQTSCLPHSFPGNVLKLSSKHKASPGSNGERLRSQRRQRRERRGAFGLSASIGRHPPDLPSLSAIQAGGVCLSPAIQSTAEQAPAYADTLEFNSHSQMPDAPLSRCPPPRCCPPPPPPQKKKKTQQAQTTAAALPLHMPASHMPLSSPLPHAPAAPPPPKKLKEPKKELTQPRPPPTSSQMPLPENLALMPSLLPRCCTGEGASGRRACGEGGAASVFWLLEFFWGGSTGAASGGPCIPPLPTAGSMPHPRLAVKLATFCTNAFAILLPRTGGIH